MKVLVLNGSPRVKSNTMIITNEFLEGFKEKVPDADIEVIDLKKTEIRPCLGCFGCWTKTPGKCVINDEMRNVLFPKFLAADIVVWAIPLYFYALPSEAKAFMDRTLPFALPYIEDGGTGHPHRYEKMPRTMVISNCGFYDEKIFEPMDEMFSFGYGEHETLYRTQGELFAQGIEALTGDTLVAIRQCGREYATDGRISDETKAAATKEIIPPDMFTKMANQHWDEVIAKGQSAGAEKEEVVEKKSSGTGGVTPEMMAKNLPKSYNKDEYTKDMEVQMVFTDCNETYTFHATKDELTSSKGPGTNPDLIITVSFEDWMAISNGEASGQDLVMEGRMKLKGGVPNMTAFSKLISKNKPKKDDPATEEAPAKPSKYGESGKRKPSMFWMMFPMLMYWMGAGVIAFIIGDVDNRLIYAYGGALVITIVVMLIKSTKVESTKYDYISLAIAAALCIVAILCSEYGWMSIYNLDVVSYIVFALVWLIPALMSRPVSTYYVRISNPKVAKTKIYINIHRDICVLWAGVMFITAIVHLISDDIILSYATTVITMVIGIMFSKRYPGYRVKKEFGVDASKYT